MSSGKLPAMNQAGASPTPSAPLPGTFLGLALDLGSDRLYDLVQDIPDVMGLRALRTRADVSARQPMCPGSDAGRSRQHRIPRSASS